MVNREEKVKIETENVRGGKSLFDIPVHGEYWKIFERTLETHE